MNMSRKTRFLTLILCMVLVAAMALSVTGCGKKQETAVSETTQTSFPAGEYGNGSLQFTFIVADADQNETTYTIHTDRQIVGEALQEIGLLEGEDSEYGLYVKKVNGILADYDKDKTYWAFYINGEYAMTGVDMTEVEAGTTYAFRVEK